MYELGRNQRGAKGAWSPYKNVYLNFVLAIFSTIFCLPPVEIYGYDLVYELSYE